MEIQIYTHPESRNSIFQQDDARDIMESFGIRFAESPEDACLLVANKPELLRPLISRFGANKRYLLWTHDPMFWTGSNQWDHISGQKVRTLSLHSGEIYKNNYFYAKITGGKTRPPLVPMDLRLNRKIACIATAKRSYKPGKMLGSGLDLRDMRCHLALEGWRRGKIDLYGNRWPKGAALGESRKGPWVLEKYKILQNYHFNLCFENVLYPYYCSEKIWHAIHCGCLPIYFGQKSIYEDFPQDSFIDYSRLETPEALFDLIDQISAEEFADRYNKCCAVMERAYAAADQSKNQVVKYTIEQIERLLEAN